MTGTLSTPSVGSPNSTEDPKVATAITALNANLDGTNLLDGARIGAATVPAAALASNAVTTAKITDANVTDAKLASPNNSVYKTICSVPMLLSSAAASATPYACYLKGADGTTLTSISAFDPNNVPWQPFDFASGDYSVGSLSTKFRVKMEVFVGSTSPSTVTFNAGLYPLTISAGNFTLGTVVTGSTTGTTATPSLATNTISRYASSDFAASALLSNPGTYMLGLVVGSISVPVTISATVHLQTRNV